MTPIKAIGKYLDQPLLSAKINKHIPAILTIASGAVLAKQIKDAPEGKKLKTGIKTAIILGSVSTSAIYAPKIASKLTGRQIGKTVQEIIHSNNKLVDNFIQNNKLSAESSGLIEKAKDKVLSLKEINKLFKSKELKPIATKLIPPPQDITSKDIFKEIGWLSIFGAIPVIGGVSGGILAEKLTEKNWKKKVPDKINEGLYQYLANIFLCNVGAGTALAIMEKNNIKSRTARGLGMIGGIIATGIVGGSIIANFIGKKIINPIMNKNHKHDTRTPELLDISLHADDIATVSLLSGLKWIEPSLPLLYSISGYRAGIGYRNHKPKDAHEKEAHFLRQKC